MNFYSFDGILSNSLLSRDAIDCSEFKESKLAGVFIPSVNNDYLLKNLVSEFFLLTKYASLFLIGSYSRKTSPPMIFFTYVTLSLRLKK